MFQSWFAILHPDGDETGTPSVVIGYSPEEVGLAREGLLKGEELVIGPYPVDDPEFLCRELIPKYMGIDPEPEDKQVMCYACKKPPWKSNPDCPMHPYDRLKR